MIDVDSTVCEVVGKAKEGAAFGYTKVVGYHPILATRADTGEVCHARMREGSANTARGARRFIDELVAPLRRAEAAGEIVIRFDSGFWSTEAIATWAASVSATRWRCVPTAKASPPPWRPSGSARR